MNKLMLLGHVVSISDLVSTPSGNTNLSLVLRTVCYNRNGTKNFQDVRVTLSGKMAEDNYHNLTLDDEITIEGSVSTFNRGPHDDRTVVNAHVVGWVWLAKHQRPPEAEQAASAAS